MTLDHRKDGYDNPEVYLVRTSEMIVNCLRPEQAIVSDGHGVEQDKLGSESHFSNTGGAHPNVFFAAQKRKNVGKLRRQRTLNHKVLHVS